MVDLAKIAKHAKDSWIFTSLRAWRALRDTFEKPTLKTGFDFAPGEYKKILSVIELAISGTSPGQAWRAG